MNNTNTNINNNEFSEDFWKHVANDPAVRVETARKNHLLFFHIYFPHYILYKTAPFHKEIFGLTHDHKIRTVVIEAFRGSGKSTIMSLSYPLWSILGCQQKKFILLVAQTQEQAHQYLANIKRELETNRILREDLGPFTEDEEWRSSAILIPRYNARIIAVSSDTSIRGLRHLQYRPDLIICDDLEDLASVKTRESRDKIYSWFVGDVMSLGDENTTRIVVIGTPLHEDSLIPRLKRLIKNGSMLGIVKSYPIINEAGEIAWPGKYPTLDDVEKAKQRLGSESAWQREYLLKIVPDDERIIQPDWIKYYKELPSEKSDDYRFVLTAIDLAISQNESADKTAMVSAKVFGWDKNLRIYILPDPVNERLTTLKAQERAELLSMTLGNGTPTKLIVENVAYQAAFIEMMNQRNIPTEKFDLQGQDKTARLSLAASLVQSGKVQFPEAGAEELINQLVNFGFQRYDDLADAFAMLILETIEQTKYMNYSVDFV